jgi:hypothetical protein
MPSEINPEVPPAVERVLVKALAKDADERYATPSDMMDELRLALNESGLRVVMPARFPAQETPRVMDNAPTLAEPPPPHTEQIPSGHGRYVTIPAPMPPRPPSAPRVEARVDMGDVKWDEVGRRIEEGVKRGGGVVAEIARSIQEAVDDKKRPMTDEERIRKRIEKRYEERTGLFIHLTIYIVMQLVFWGMWAGSQDLFASLFSDGSLPARALDFPWPIFVTFFWGIGVVANIMDYYNKYGPGAEKRERLIQAEVERERQRKMESYYDAKPKRDRRVRLTEDGELEEVPEDDYTDYDKPKRGRRSR